MWRYIVTLIHYTGLIHKREKAHFACASRQKPFCKFKQESMGGAIFLLLLFSF